MPAWPVRALENLSLILRQRQIQLRERLHDRGHHPRQSWRRVCVSPQKRVPHATSMRYRKSGTRGRATSSMLWISEFRPPYLASMRARARQINRQHVTCVSVCCRSEEALWARPQLSCCACAAEIPCELLHTAAVCLLSLMSSSASVVSSLLPLSRSSSEVRGSFSVVLFRYVLSATSAEHSSREQPQETARGNDMQTVNTHGLSLFLGQDLVVPRRVLAS